MDKHQADAVSEAILEPSLKAQAADLRQLQARAGRTADQRNQALYFIVGYVAGAAIGYFAFGRIASYGLASGFVGMVFGALVARLANRAAA
ncbi:hypothetical protein [Lysobacter sp. A03]|uniref:hypothetical protein n=1 Tax=Lysobacter sp. A03 TaxID=1199154 RepID=UPI0005B6DEE8|nr:hypothetical protein [Lysobacter sp. A03]KIQ97227.1 hypothetical protein TI01_1212 [Lysobacter sp. A03]